MGLQDKISDYHKDRNNETYRAALAALKDSKVTVPCQVIMTEEARRLYDMYHETGRKPEELSPEESKRLYSGITFSPVILVNSGHRFMAAFSGDAEMSGRFGDKKKVLVPFPEAARMALGQGEDLEGIVVNAFTGPFTVRRDLLKETLETELPPATIDTLRAAADHAAEGSGPRKQQTVYQNSADLQLAVGRMDVFNFALYQNRILPVRGIVLQNRTEDPIEDLKLRISSDYDFLRPYEKDLPAVPAGKPVRIPDPHLHINGSTLAEMTEAVPAEIKVEVCRKDEVLCGCRGQMLVLAYDQWQGSESYRDLLPAFVLPNHPVIPVLLHDAAERLKKWEKSPALDGYQKKDPNRVRDLAAAAYAAIQKKNIFYAEPPASFAGAGQRIRTPETILEQRLGTCMDMTLLYAACLEAMGLHPLLVMMKNHIFAGVWLRERTVEEIKSGSVVLDNLRQLTTRIDNGADELTFIECTCMCAGRQVSFEAAERTAKYESLADSGNFRFAIDVYSSRHYGVKPIASRITESGKYRIDFEDKAEAELTAAPRALDISGVAPASAKSGKALNKRELWESKLLDLTLRNMLLNLPKTRSVVPIMSSHIDELEDALADGHEFRLLPSPEFVTGISAADADDAGGAAKGSGGAAKDSGRAAGSSGGSSGAPVPWLSDMLSRNAVYEITQWPAGEDYDIGEKFRHEFRNHRLYTFRSEKQLDRELTTMYRAARASQQENGVSSLYLAIGLLRWYAPEEDKPCYAPLILQPVEFVRKSANQGYALHARDEDPHFNTTLAELLKQNYNLEIHGLDPLPTDEHGINIRRVFSIVRSALVSLKNWEVIESCALGNFSFAQFAIWNDIHTAGDALEQSKIVRSLMKGHVDWDVSVPEGVPEEQVYLPIAVDSTQLQAIRMAAHGMTFVLHGPPGTGKSQTITGMIANLMARGKNVLFVAEKMAALSVVEKRLSALGIGDFCLELHSDKATKKQVLSQLNQALAAKEAAKRGDYGAAVKKDAEIRARLDEYSRHLHQVHYCGYSLHELIDLYEAVGPVERRIDFDVDAVKMISEDMLRRHDSAISGLTAAGSAVEDFSNNPLMGVGLADYNAEIRRQVLPAVTAYQAALEAVRDKAAEADSLLDYAAQAAYPGRNAPYADDAGFAPGGWSVEGGAGGRKLPGTAAELAALKEMTDLYTLGKNMDPMYLNILNGNTMEAEAYYQRQDALKQEEQGLLQKWDPQFLASGMPAWREKHAAAGRKFFGKAAAMEKAAAEIQSFARIRIVYEQIPALLDEVEHYQMNQQSLQGFRQSLTQEGRAMIEALPTRAEYFRAAKEAAGFRERLQQFPGGLAGIRRMAQNRGTDGTFREYQELYETYETAKRQLNGLLHRDAKKTGTAAPARGQSLTQYGGPGQRTEPDERTGPGQRTELDERTGPGRRTELDQERIFCAYLKEHTAMLKDWALYNQARGQCMVLGLKPVVDAYEAGMPAEQLYPAYRKGIAFALITDIISSDDALSMFSGATFNETVQQFRRLDESLQERTRSEIFQILAARAPADAESPETGKELNILRKAIGSNARGMSIRVLFERIPHILPRLTPCMLMSPNSVAQYLAQRNDLFDVVIFDEASQLPTCKAAGALMRAENAVIVGDPKQMPPTTFFAGGGPEVDDIVLDDLDSILDDVLALGVPSCHLQWHYRSRHESLIAFSNSEFYENRMFTFPSANDRERRVTAVHVEGSVYERGTNLKEAEVIVGDILRRYRDPALRDQTVGVVTFNVKQQALIENILMKQFAKDPEFDAWANSREDPLFIKNLETVQGDERDVILFSIGYGPDEKGRISMNFGPINKEGGGKRLNVAFSRARMEMRIFSSLYSSDIRVTETSPEGLKAFRDFLYFAEGHGLAASSAAGRRGYREDGILKSICDAIRGMGFQCETMIGHSDFRVDIAVVDPFEPTEYLMGIMLDGDTYRRTGNTRDREIAQAGVLKNLGWKIRRLWTMDWWDNRNRELRSLAKELAELKEQARIRAEQKAAEEEKQKAAEEERAADAEALRKELSAAAAEAARETEAAAAAEEDQ